jgi:integrase
MPINFTIQFNSSPAYHTYVVRFRDPDPATPLDTKRVVPASYWARLGHRMPRTEGAKFFALAHAWAADEVRRIEDRRRAVTERIATAKMSVAEVWALYRAENPRLVGADTIKRDGVSYAALGRHLELGRLVPEDVTQPVAVRYRNARRQDKTRSKEPVRWRTIRNELDFLRRLVTFAFRWQSETGMTSLRFTELPDIEEDDSLQVALTEQEVGAILEHVSGRNRRIILFGVCSMLRKTPLLALRNEWIDRGRVWLDVPADFMKKGRSKRRRALSVPIASTALSQITDEGAGLSWPNEATAKPLVWLDEALEAIADAAETRGFSLHDLRSTGATWLKNAGVDRLVIKALMGHSMRTGDVTDLYTKVLDGLMREAVAVFDDIFARILGTEQPANVVSIATSSRGRSLRRAAGVVTSIHRKS